MLVGRELTAQQITQQNVPIPHTELEVRSIKNLDNKNRSASMNKTPKHTIPKTNDVEPFAHPPPLGLFKFNK